MKRHALLKSEVMEYTCEAVIETRIGHNETNIITNFELDMSTGVATHSKIS